VWGHVGTPQSTIDERQLKNWTTVEDISSVKDGTSKRFEQQDNREGDDKNPAESALSCYYYEGILLLLNLA